MTDIKTIDVHVTMSTGGTIRVRFFRISTLVEAVQALSLRSASFPIVMAQAVSTTSGETYPYALNINHILTMKEAT